MIGATNIMAQATSIIGTKFRHANGTREWIVTATSMCETIVEITSNGQRKTIPAAWLTHPELEHLTPEPPLCVETIPWSAHRAWSDVENGTWSMDAKGVWA